jgi:hypothetical protein
LTTNVSVAFKIDILMMDEKGLKKDLKNTGKAYIL